MKVHIVLTDNEGKVFEGIAELTLRGKSPKGRKAKEARSRGDSSLSLNLNLNLNPRAFMKKHGGSKSGPRKFTLLMAKLANGKANVEVRVDDVKSLWNQMKPVMGGPYNPVHANRAKENGWVDSAKRGVFVLSSTWKDALTEK